MKELKKPNALEENYQILQANSNCPDKKNCDDLTCFCRGIDRGRSVEEEDEILF